MADSEAVTILGRLGVLVAAGVLAGCSSSPPPTAQPASEPAPPIVAATPSPSSSPSAPQSDGFSGPGQFNVAWNGVTVAPAKCPAAHPTAICYTATGSASLPMIGQVTLTRKVIVGDGTANPPAGCVNAQTVGTLASATGTMMFTADGELCGKRTSFTVTSSTAGGSMSADSLQAVIINDASATDAITETWSGQIAQK